MEKFRERVTCLRTEAESAIARADEIEQKVKELETENTFKNQALLSLQKRIQVLEQQLDSSEKGLKTMAENFNEVDVIAKRAEQKMEILEQGLTDQQEKYERLQELHIVSQVELTELVCQFNNL